MTVRQLSIETGRDERLIREYVKEFMPEIDSKKGKRLEFSEYHYEKIKELLESLTINGFAEKYGYTFHVVSKHIREHYPDIDRYHDHCVINKKYEMAILQTLKKQVGERVGTTNELYRGYSLCKSCYYYNVDKQKCDFFLVGCEGKRYINRDGK